MHRILCCGSRDWRNKSFIYDILSKLRDELGVFVVIEGENGEKNDKGKVVKGADKFCREVAEELSLPVEPYPAKWHKYGNAAGPIRNTQMLVEGKPAGVLAFHLDLLKSKGTRNMVEQSLKAYLPVWIASQGEQDFLHFIAELKRIQESRLNDATIQ